MKIFNNMIKKKLYIVIFLIAIFIIPISSAKAFDYVDYTRDQNFGTYDKTEPVCEVLSNYFKTTNYKYLITSHSGGTGKVEESLNPMTHCIVHIFNENTTNVNLTLEKASSSYIFRQQASSVYFNSFSTVSYAQDFINWVDTNGRIPTSSDTGFPSTRLTRNFDNIFSNLYFNATTGVGEWSNRVMLYDSNITFTIKKLSSVIHNISFNNGQSFIETNDLYPIYKILNPGLPTEEEYIGIESQVFSIDNVITDELPHDIDFSFYLKQDRNWIIDSFDTYRLYENNGLYHYEKATTTDKMCTMADYVESVNEDNKWTIKLIDLTCDKSDGAVGFYYKINLTNVFDYARLELKEKMPISYVNTFSWNRIIKTFNTNQFKYINFSSNLDNYIDTWYMYSNEFTGEIAREMYFTYFNLDSLAFFDYLDEGAESKPAVYNPLLGQEMNRGLTLNRKNTHILDPNYNHFNFELAFNPNNLYFSITENDGTALNDNTVIVDNEGNPNNVDIELEEGIGTGVYTDYSSLFKNINKFMRDYMVYISEFFGLFTYGFNKLDSQIRTFIIAIFTMVVTVVVITRLRK